MLGREVIHLYISSLVTYQGLVTAQSRRMDCWSWSSACGCTCIARQNLKQAQHRQKRDYDLRVVNHHYNQGDLVYKIDSTTKVGQSQKLRSSWAGPSLVVTCRPPLYTIRDRIKQYVIHNDKLMLCQDREIPVWLRRLRHQHFQTDQELPDEDSSSNSSMDYELDIGDQGLDSESPDVDLATSDKSKESSRQTRAGRSIRPPNKYKDFQL